MAIASDNLLLQALCDIRAPIDVEGERFDKIEKKLDDMPETLAYTAGVPVHAGVRHEGARKRLDALKRRIERLEERV